MIKKWLKLPKETDLSLFRFTSLHNLGDLKTIYIKLSKEERKLGEYCLPDWAILLFLYRRKKKVES